MIHLYLDDRRPCPEGFVLARTAEECMMLLADCEIGVLSLDYDLGWNQPTGLEVAAALLEQRSYPQSIYLHSSSIWGRNEMYQLLYPNLPEQAKLFNFPMPDEILNRIKGENRHD